MNFLTNNKEAFARGIQLINAVLSEQHQIKGEAIETYFLLLKDYDKDLYLQGILSLLKNEDLRYGAPSPAVIIQYINKENKVAERILEQLKMDILLYPEKPKYKPEIEALIEEAGGWDKLKNGSEKEFREVFVNGFLQKGGLLLGNDKKLIR